MTCGQEPIPSYLELFKGIYNFTSKVLHDIYVKDEEPKPLDDSFTYFHLTLNDMLFPLFLAATFTILRSVSTSYVLKPMAKKFRLTPMNQRKMPESAWKFVFYFCAWSFSFYILILSGKHCFFYQPSTLFDNWDPSKEVPFDIFLMYAIQSGFYIHSLYATLFLDTWRKDSIVMMMHHILTLILCGISYALRYHNSGILVLFLHDMCDIQLEFTKLNVYFKIQNDKNIRRHEILANITFFCFAITWFMSRLYWYPLKVLYAASSVVLQKNLILPCATFINILLWVLQAMNIYWFLYIVGFLLRVFTGRVQELDDTREYDVEEKFSQQLSAKLDSVSETVYKDSSEGQNNGVSTQKPHTNGDTTMDLHSRKRLKS